MTRQHGNLSFHLTQTTEYSILTLDVSGKPIRIFVRIVTRINQTQWNIRLFDVKPGKKKEKNRQTTDYDRYTYLEADGE